MSTFLNILIPVIVGSLSLIGTIIIWALNQAAGRAAERREHQRQLYLEVIEAVFTLCSLKNTVDAHVKALFVLDRAWLFASRNVLEVINEFLKHYTEICDGVHPVQAPRDDKKLENLIHNVFAEMRKELVAKPLFTLGLFEYPPVKARIEFYAWSQEEYSGLLRQDQTYKRKESAIKVDE